MQKLLSKAVIPIFFLLFISRLLRSSVLLPFQSRNALEWSCTAADSIPNRAGKAHLFPGSFPPLENGNRADC